MFLFFLSKLIPLEQKKNGHVPAWNRLKHLWSSKIASCLPAPHIFIVEWSHTVALKRSLGQLPNLNNHNCRAWKAAELLILVWPTGESRLAAKDKTYLNTLTSEPQHTFTPSLMNRVVLPKYHPQHQLSLAHPFFSWPRWLTGFFFPLSLTYLFHSFRTRKDQLTLERHNRSTHHRPQLLMKPSARGILPLHNYPAALSPWATRIRLPTPWEAACKWVQDIKHLHNSTIWTPVWRWNASSGGDLRSIQRNRK